MRIASILNEKEITLSCEVFPPKHFDGIAQASAVAQEIAGLHPSFMDACDELGLFVIENTPVRRGGQHAGAYHRRGESCGGNGRNAAVPPDVRAVDKGACAACAGGHEDCGDGERAGAARRPAQGRGAVP